MPVIETSLEKESRDRYLTYALSVVSGRALPDVRDGLKPVQRRILYTMYSRLGLVPDGPHRKSATVVGEVLGKFHPHGDAACYEAMVRMAQDFSLRYPLVDGQGNFGSLDGDNAAAYRYTEAKLRSLALYLIGEIDEETVEYRDNFDASTKEPVVFPSRIPNLLINGASGIAVGMATSIPPHNLKDTIKALIELSNDPEISNNKLVAAIKGPDFPTGCQILNTKSEIEEMYRTGKGSIRMRGEWSTEDLGRGKMAIVVTSIPYATNKSQIVEQIAGAIIEKKVPQLIDVRDESTDDVRVVIELAPGADAARAMAYLYKNTTLENNFSANFTALVPSENGSLKPEVVSLKSCLQHFITFREKVTQRRLTFEKKKLLERVHILEGFVIIYDALDEALKIVRKSDGRADAAQKLRVRFALSELQSLAVVDLKIYQLSRTNIDEIRGELDLKHARVTEIDKLLASKKKLAEIVRKELEEIAEKFGDKRKCKLVRDEDAIELDFRAEDYVVIEDVFAIVTVDGWVKRIRQNNELSSTRVREGDKILKALPLSTADSVVFFTNLGALYSMKVHDFPSSSGYGEPLQKELKFRDGERVVDIFGVKATALGKPIITPPAQKELISSTVPAVEYLEEGSEVVLISKDGMGFILRIAGLIGLKRSGKRIMKVREGDVLVAVRPAKDWIATFTKGGLGLRFKRSELPVREDSAIGVIAMGLKEGDSVVGAVTYSGKTKLQVTTDAGKVVDLDLKDVTEGHRALKGTKVIGRGELVSAGILGS